MAIGTRLLAVALLALVVGGGTAFAQNRNSTQPACGAVITVDTKLAADLTGCPGDGIVIGADGITLDLNGHSIGGDAAPGATGPDVGIRSVGFDGVTIENGTVQEFDFGVLVREASGDAFRGVVSTRNGRAGARLEAVADSRFTGSTIAGNGTFGINFFGGNHGNVTAHNTVSDNGQGGIGDFVSEHDRIEHNVVSGNGEDGITIGSSSDTVVEHNTVSGNFAGITSFGSDRTAIGENRVSQSHFGILLEGDGDVVAANMVTDILGCDDDDACGLGISLSDGSSNVIVHNAVARTANSGIALEAFGGPVVGTVLEHNDVRDAAGDGIAVDVQHAGPVLDTLLEHDSVTGATDDGIDVDSASTTLTHNHATQNGDLGIEAVPGVVDGGGNHAAHNGNPAQCTSVAC